MADDSGDVNRLVARARECFLEAGDVAQVSLRPGVVESWRRSQLYGVDYNDLDPPYFADLDTDGRLMYAARPILDRLENTLSGMATSLLITDPKGRVLDRRVGDGALLGYLDSLQLAPGFSYAEEYVGTNGIGTALETSRVSLVCGSEHFTERLNSMTCSAAPIREPLTGRLLGLVDVTCWSKDGGPLMPVLVSSVASDIEQRLLEIGSEREQAMLAEFLAVGDYEERVVLTVSDSLTIESRLAAGLLTPDDHAILRDKIGELVRSGREDAQILLSRGELVTMRYRLVGSDAGTAAAMVEIDMAQRSRSAPKPLVQPADLGLAGTSFGLSKVCTDLRTHCQARTWALVEGEPGVGKLALAEAVHRAWPPKGPLVVIEPQHLHEDMAACLRRMTPGNGSGQGTVVLRHPERFTPGALETVVKWMDLACEWPQRPWVVVTTTGAADLAEALVRRLPVTLTVPPLRHRIDDVRDLVPALLRRFAGGRSVSCGQAAMRLLLRSTWPGNVAELADVVRHALTRRRIGQIQLEDLPESYHATSRHVLSPWETLERDAIVRALLETDGNRAAAADLLGISRATIYRKINAFGISVDQRRP